MSSLTGDGNDLALHYGGMYASPTRSKGALKSILECLSGCQIRIHEFQGQWMRLSKSEQTRLVSKSMPEGQFAQLGAGASLGKKPGISMQVQQLSFSQRKVSKSQIYYPRPIH